MNNIKTLKTIIGVLSIVIILLATSFGTYYLKRHDAPALITAMPSTSSTPTSTPIVTQTPTIATTSPSLESPSTVASNSTTNESFLELLSPKGEQFLCRGETRNISWRGSKNLSTVSIYISTIGKSGSGSYPIGSFPASYNESGIKNGEGTYSWKAGYTNSGIELPLNETYQIIMNGCIPYENGSGCRMIFNKNPEPFSFLDCRG